MYWDLEGLGFESLGLQGPGQDSIGCMAFLGDWVFMGVVSRA